MLWPWYRPAATALIQPLVWELPYAKGAALKKKKKKVKKRREKKEKYDPDSKAVLPDLQIAANDAWPVPSWAAAG